MKIFKITADYKKQEPHPYHYFCGIDKENAKKAFKEAYTWLDIFDIEEVDFDDIKHDKKLTPLQRNIYLRGDNT